MADSEEPEQDIRRALDVDQSMIDIWADRLEGLRTQCSTSAELTQQEIRTLEVHERLLSQLLTSRKIVTRFDYLPTFELSSPCPLELT